MDGVYAGAFAGVVTTVTMHPLDLAKVRLQVGRETSLMNVLRDLVSHRWTNAYRGLTPNLIGNAAAWGAYFGCYEVLQKFAFGSTLQLRETSTSHLGCAFTAGIMSQALTNPIWVLKTRILGSKPTDKYASPRLWKNVKAIYARSGVKGFWRGFWPGTLGTAQSALYFALYAPIKPWIRQNIQLPDTATYFVSSTIAKSIAATVMYPHQVIRARMQFSEMKLLEAIRDVLLKER